MRLTSPRLTTILAACSSSVAAAERGAALAFARRGPLWPQLEGLAAAPPAADWETHGAQLIQRLTGSDSCPEAPADLDPAVATRVYHLYLPIYFFMRHQLQQHRGLAAEAAGASPTMALGLSAPQGCGKTTLVELLVDRFAADGIACAAVSIDDFYLTGAAQDALATAHPSNPLFQVRGNAGTHDLPLGTRVLTELKRPPDGAAPQPVRLPRYDKAARAGRGDRAPESTWPEVPRADVVLLEGWMAGFAALPADAAVLGEHPGLAEVNARLAGYRAWDALMDAWVVLGVDDPAHVYEWRLQAERAMAAAGRPGMSDEQVADFVSRYMPAYRAYLPALYAAAAKGARGVGGKPTMMVRVDAGRNPVGGGEV